MLSIVVPIYNVGPYLDECLSSIAAQTRDDLQVVMVDDGSTDDSAATAARFADKDSRFTLVRKANAGLGAARNTGLEHATGEYLMFVDSDDSLPPYAAEVLIAALETTGSDFSCGNVLRYNTRGMRQSPMHRAPFTETRLRTHVRKRPGLLVDRTAWNKVFRRSFFDAHGFRFPEGVLYEDIPVTVPAHALAKSVDVLSLPVYFWRQREGEDRSITQRRGEIPAFVDRLENCWSASRSLADLGETALKRHYDTSVLTSDLMLFVKVLPDVGPEYHEVFLERTNAYLDTVDPAIIDELDTNLRVLWTLIRHRKLAELLTFIPTVRKPRRIARRGLRRYHDLELFRAGLPELPPEVFLAGTPAPRTKVHDVAWRDGKLHVRGHAFIPGQAAPKPWSTSRLFWMQAGKGTRTRRTPLVTRRCPDATADHGSALATYDWSGFEAVIDPDALRADGARDRVWTATVGVLGLGRWSKGPVEIGQPAHPLRLTSRYADGVRITPYVGGGKLRVRVESAPARVTGIHPVETDGGRYVEIEGDLHPAGGTLTARLSRAAGVPWRTYPVEADGARFRFRVPAGDLQDDGVTYPPLRDGEPPDRWLLDLELTGADGKARALPLPLADEVAGGPVQLGARIVHLHATADRHPVLVALPAGPVVTDVTTAARAYRIAGRVPDGPGDWSRLAVVLRLGAGKEYRTFPARVDGREWSVEIDPVAVPQFDGHVRLRAGSWHVLCRNGDEPVRPLPAAPGVLDALPLPLAGDAPRVSLEWQDHERIVVRVRSAVPDTERGRAHAARLRTTRYPAMRSEPLRDAVLYASFTGRQYSDSPKAVHAELVARGLPLTHLWLSADGQAPVPPTAEPVPLWSRRWYDALATSRYIVTNQRLPEWFRRRDGQIVVQTWHGTPVRRIGLDAPGVTATDRKRLPVEAANWSYLVSPNPASTPILRRALGYTGEVLEIGAPRTDLLFRDRAEIDARIRSVAGIPQDKRVVLYAPDDETPVRLDVADAAARLGADHVLLLRHPVVPEDTRDGFAYDMSAYPDVIDLLAIADVLVTDHAPVMADFACTGRPMLFVAPDGERPDLYLDLATEAPGPVVTGSEAVVSAIRDLDAATAGHRDAYAAYAAQVAPPDGGRATATLVDRMLEAAAR